MAAERRLNGQDVDLKYWPCPDVSHMSSDVQVRFTARKAAVDMFSSGASSQDVRKNTGIEAREVRRIVSRCLTPGSNGSVSGYYGCLPGYRVKVYERSCDLAQVRQVEKGGSSGALRQLFMRFPCAKGLVEDLFLKRPMKDHIHEPCITKRGIHQKWIKHLRSLGFSDTAWPFNTRNRGYISLCNYLRTVEHENLIRATKARHGINAAARLGAGTGNIPLISARRAFEIMQMDYQVVDCESEIVIENSYGVEIEVLVPRWYYGLMGDEYSGLITGLHIGFEVNPSSDSALKIVDSSLYPRIYEDSDPRIAYIGDGRILPNELLPTISNQCFAILRVDNAFANAARATVNNIIDTVGCAVDFGPPKAWWHRPIVERIFKDLTAMGCKRLPASYGSGPTDPNVTNPAAEALRFRIRSSELVGTICAAVKKHNQDVSSGREFSSPLEVTRASILHPRSGFISQPLPRETIDNPRLLKYVHECRVSGNMRDGIRPHIIWDGCRYENNILSGRSDLIGEKLILYCDLNDIRNVVATVKSSGQDLGAMIPERKWRRNPVSVRFRKLINQAGAARKFADESDDPRDMWEQEKLANLAATKSTKRAAGKIQRTSAKAILTLAASHLASSESAPQYATAETLKSSPSPKYTGFGTVCADDLPVIARR